MGKPRSTARKLANGYRPRRRSVDELSPEESAFAESCLWFCMLVTSGKERAVERALRLIGYPAAFSPLDVRYRRTSGMRKRLTQTHERFNVATMPGYVFLGVPASLGGLPWSHISKAREKITPGGLSFLRGFIAQVTYNRPARLSASSIRELMAQSQIPLFRDDEFETDFDFDYGAAGIDDVLEPGEEVLVVNGLLAGSKLTFKRSEGLHLVCEGPAGELKVPAAHAVASNSAA